jgi:myosin-crossreactive antigen
MKYGAQITTTKDGSWSVSQLIQKKPNGKFIRDTLAVTWVLQESPNAERNLLKAIKNALAGKIKKTSLSK